MIDVLRSRLNAPEPPQSNTPGLVTLHLDDVDVRKALEMLSREGSVSILVAPGVTGRVTADLQALDPEEALAAILKLCNLVACREGRLIYVYSPQEVPQAERSLRAFPLDYVAVADVLDGAQGLLSPVGKAFSTESSPTDNRKTQEVLVVEDVPDHLDRVAQYVSQIDRPPRQVMIQVHVLQVDLDDEKHHGVNFEQIFRVANSDVTLQLHGLANPAAPQAFYLDVQGTDLEALVECLKTTTDAKTLASPRVMVLNGQEARIQIGEKLPYLVTTVTETAAMQNVEFLDVGVVLTVTPRISRGNNVILRVNPKVSSGEIIEGDVPLPQEETTEVETNVLLPDGRGMVIGGLIQEKDSNVQSKIPWLGDLWLVGTLFQRRQLEKNRTEIIITLMPRVLPYEAEYEVQDQVETSRAATPLLEGPLNRYPRPWEPSLPDAIYNPRVIRLPCVHGEGCPCRRAVRRADR